MTELLWDLLVVMSAVSSYAVGYFRERKIPDPPEVDPELPKDSDASLRLLFEAYSEEVRAKYLRNHSRRRAEKFLKEFGLSSVHFVIFAGLALACATIELFEPGLSPTLLLVALAFLTMALKAGQLTASKETVERKEQILIHQTELVNRARRNMLANCPKEVWVQAMQIRDEKSPLHY